MLEIVLGLSCRKDECPYCRETVLAGMFTKDHVIPRAARACWRGNADVCPLTLAEFHNPLLDAATCFKSEGVKDRCFLESPNNALAVCEKCNNRKKDKSLRSFLDETGVVPHELNPMRVVLNPSVPGTNRLRGILLNDIPSDFVFPFASSEEDSVGRSSKANTLHLRFGLGHTLTPPTQWVPTPQPSMTVIWSMGALHMNLTLGDRDTGKSSIVPIKLSPHLTVDEKIVALHVDAPEFSHSGSYIKSAATLLGALETASPTLPKPLSLWHKGFWLWVWLDFTKWFVSRLGAKPPADVMPVNLVDDLVFDFQPQLAFSLNWPSA